MIKKGRLDGEAKRQVELICKTGMITCGKVWTYIFDTSEACSAYYTEISGSECIRTPKSHHAERNDCQKSFHILLIRGVKRS
jgi:hypothetical protein